MQNGLLEAFDQSEPLQLYTCQNSFSLYVIVAAQNCVAQLQPSQKQREHSLVAVIGKDAIQLWWVRAAQAQLGMWRGLDPICTNKLPLAMQANSYGLQMLVRWLRTDWEVRMLL